VTRSASLLGPTFTESDNDGALEPGNGAKIVLSTYALPSDETMVFASISYSTVWNFVQFQTKAGMKLIGNFYIGPEAVFSRRNVIPEINNVAQMRLGAQFSAVSFGPFQIGVSGGWAHQPDFGSGYYGSVNFYLTY
jgi:hypothetical protein